MHAHEASVNDASSIVSACNVDRHLFFNCLSLGVNGFDAVDVFDLRLDHDFRLCFDDLYRLRGLRADIFNVLFAGNSFAVELTEEEDAYAREG